MRRTTLAATVLGSGLVGLILTYTFVAREDEATAAKQTPPAVETKDDKSTEEGQRAPEEVTSEDLKPGQGPGAKHGDTLTVHYRVALDDGTVVDDSHKKGKPFAFILGEGNVIVAWDRGLLGMKAGGVRKLIAPPSLAYGKRGISGLIPPQARLHFEIELLGIEGPKGGH